MSGTSRAGWRQAGLASAFLLLALGLVPSLVFAFLVIVGALHPLAALLAWGTCCASAVIFALLLWRDIAVMTRLVRALSTTPEALPRERPLRVPGMSELGEEALRLIHAERLLRARSMASAAEDRALVERLPDPLLKLDLEGKVVWRNDSAIAAFGNEMAALMRHPDLRTALVEALSADLPIRRELFLSAPVSRDLEVTLIPVGKQLYMLVSDRTRERALEKMRADFVANSSHELRTPLASLIGFIETLRGAAAEDKEAQQYFLGIMAEQAARMQRLIGDLLSLSKIEISEHSQPKDIIKLAPLLGQVAMGMAPVFESQGAVLVMDASVDMPDIPGDADQLVQIFTNLLDNALKYGKAGGKIRLTASVSFDTRFPSGGVMISVSDEGAGIPREHIPRLTERFYRVDKGRSRTVGGTGLGLAIVKHVVNRHRGRLMIDSEVGQGTVFTVWLPGVSR